MIFKIKKSARNLLTFLSLSLVFLLIFLSTFLAYGETLIEENVQDTFSTSPDGIIVEKKIEYCGRLGADIREKLVKEFSQDKNAQNVSPDTLPTEDQLNKFSNQLLFQWRKELPFSILINGKYIKLYPVALKIEKSQGIEDPLNLKLTLKTKNFKFSPGDYTLFYTNQSFSRLTDELLSQFRDKKEYSKLTLLRLCNVKINFSSAVQVLYHSLGQISSQEPQTIYSIYLNEPKDKVMVKFKMPQQSKSSDKNKVKIKK